MEFRVLGRLEVEADGVDVTPRRPKQRTLLALLLLRAGDVVSADELVEALWEGQPPETAQTALHGHVSALRKQLGRERIETRPPGYVLHLAANDELDVYRLERLVEEARAADPRGREEKLKQALALFHGEPLADFRFEAFARPEADRLDELRAATLEDDVDAELALGRHRDVLPRLERMVAEHPLRERLRAQLMLALYRSGRQADALAAFTEERELLVSELGIEPSPALQRLERQILNQAPELSPPELLAPLEREPAAKPAGIVTLAVVDTTEDAQAAMVASSAARSGGIALDGRPGSSAFAFGRARDAAAFAAAVQGFRRYRIGLDSAEVGAGGSYSTHVVRAAAGVCAAAHEGQILVTAATRTLLREAGVGDADLVEVGEHRLQDLAPPRRLFQLSVLGLEGEFPPVRGLESLATNLPVQPTPLLGRERELREISALLRRPDASVVTLTGAAGTGKTRLATHAAAELLDEFPDGVFFVDLAPLADPRHVVTTIARTLGLRAADGDAAAEALRSELAERTLLLVLDNFEHLLPAAPAVADATSATAVTVLATSRAPLRLPGEHVYAVSPLPLPEQVEDAARLLEVDSVALLVSRARGTRPEFTATEENAHALVGICRALDGLPLAIELAATRIAVLPPGDLLDRLDRRLAILTRGAPDAPRRQRALRAAVDWSYDLLETDQKLLLARLGAFAGGSTLAAVEEVCGDGIEVVDAIGALVDASLVRLEGSDEEPRFGMLETIREYAVERLRESDEPAVRRKHATYFLALAEDTEQHLRGNPGDWLDVLEREQANLRAALDWLSRAGDEELLLRLAGALWRFWYLAGHLAEGREWLEDALARNGAGSPARAKALLGAAVMAVNLGYTDDARRRAEEALELHRALGDDWGIAYSLFILAPSVETERARDLYDESRALFNRVGDEHSALLAGRELAVRWERLGELERARALHEENLELARATGNGRIEASTLSALAMMLVEQGRVDDAIPMLKESLRIHGRLGDLLDTEVALCRAAHLLAVEGRAQPAAQLLAAFEAAGERLGSRRNLVAEMNAATLRAIRTQLDRDAFEDAWAKGRALSIDEALALALDWLG